MLSSQDFIQRLKSHRGGLVRFTGDFYLPDSPPQSLSSKIGILIDARAAWPGSARPVVSLLIDGSVKEIYVAPGQLELIGGTGDE